MESRARQVLELYGYQEVRTPLIEDSAVFTRSLGSAEEIVTKQMYLFQDRGGREVALRPEGTASVVRALIERGLDKTGGLTRLYYLGPMFRAERPQAGRRRQFHQLGVEVFGSASPYQDAEVLALLTRLLREAGAGAAVLKINNIGCRQDRPEMVKRLKEYFKGHLDHLCQECKLRLEKNPLRIFDCKQERCRSIAHESNKPSQWACGGCREHFDKARQALDLLGIPYEVDHQIVRGLDYYTRTVFEAVHEGLGAQNAIGAGGRYDDLVGQMGGEPVPAVGFALGLERILMAQEQEAKVSVSSAKRPQVFVATVSPAEIPKGLALAEALREKGIACVNNVDDRPLKRQLEQAEKWGCVLVAIQGEAERSKKVVTVKQMAARAQTEVPEDQWVEKVKELLAG